MDRDVELDEALRSFADNCYDLLSDYIDDNAATDFCEMLWEMFEFIVKKCRKA